MDCGDLIYLSLHYFSCPSFSKGVRLRNYHSPFPSPFVRHHRGNPTHHTSGPPNTHLTGNKEKMKTRLKTEEVVIGGAFDN